MAAGASISVPLSGFPAIVVPAGFTREVYDRVPDANDPNGSRLDGPKPDQTPVAMEFLARPFDEAALVRDRIGLRSGNQASAAAESIWAVEGRTVGIPPVQTTEGRKPTSLNQAMQRKSFCGFQRK